MGSHEIMFYNLNNMEHLSTQQSYRFNKLTALDFIKQSEFESFSQI